MTFSRTTIAGMLCGLMLAGGAFAQTPPAAPAAPATSAASATPTAPAPMAPAMDKKAINKACLDEATQQNLHGKARKAFKSKCKREKMKAM